MLSNRLLALVSLINQGSIMADVGSDHALLPCYCVSNGIVSKAYAIDNKKGPIQNAIKNIESHGLEDSVFTILQSGIIDLPKDVSSIVIAGMGFNMIQDIILNDLDIAKSVDQIVIQSNNLIPELRNFFNENNFLVLDERFTVESGKSYTMFSIQYSIKPIENIPLYYSERLIKENNLEYINHLIKRHEALKQLKEFNTQYQKEFSVLSEILDL